MNMSLLSNYPAFYDPTSTKKPLKTLEAKTAVHLTRFMFFFHLIRACLHEGRVTLVEGLA